MIYKFVCWIIDKSKYLNPEIMLREWASKEKCPPHKWDSSGERCLKCGDKDWMT